jgi:AmmeMemoRadiSam system protein A
VTSDADRQSLLDLARDAIAAHVTGGPLPAVPDSGAAAEPGGVFVTIHKQGQLRGCIGHIEANEKVGVIVARCAVQACSRDPRFPAVDARELPHLEIELSLLGPLEAVTDADQIEVGRHGLVIEDGWHRGLLLPQVATEWGWDRATFLAHTCQKAGLSPDAWTTGARLWRFEAEVFGDGRRTAG